MPDKKGHPQPFFQLFYLAAQWRLRHKQPFGSASQAAFLRNDREIIKMPYIDCIQG
ncbi:hypothetical protein HNQ38_001100 [Desulfovibrio intestinalis]|uniref:Uncharacterized protein n=1 Tax=Desulfovibrio intestinalis TaxID=58621 RepID=A0A7W8FGQ0_9BACT|nr:hypothetical protein [Desulfovibrio intestinalis]